MAKRKTAHRSRVLQAATEMFLTHGYGISIDDIAKGAGVTRQTIYNTFGSKFGLISEVAHELSKEIVPDLLRFRFEKDIRAGLLIAAESYIEIVLDPRSVQFHRILSAYVAHEPEMVLSIYNQVAKPIEFRLEEYLLANVAKGVLRPMNAELAMEQFLGLVIGPLHQRAAYGVDIPPEKRREQAEEAVRTFLRAYGAKSD